MIARLALLSLLFAGSTVSAPVPTIQLLETGAFHGDEVNARSGERWMGIAEESSGVVWRRYILTVRKVEDPIVDGPGEKTGKAVSVRGPKPVFLIKGLDHLRAAKVETTFSTPLGQRLAEHALPALVLGSRSYRLHVTNVKRDDAEPSKPSELWLESEGLRQHLYTWPDGLDDEYCELVWAGDLDGDGRLDLYMRLSDHYNVSERTLFLSSKAGPQRIVEKVAVWITTGC